MKFVNNRVMKKDAMSLVTGQAVYTDDIAPKDALIPPNISHQACLR